MRRACVFECVRERNREEEQTASMLPAAARRRRFGSCCSYQQLFSPRSECSRKVNYLSVPFEGLLWTTRGTIDLVVGSLYAPLLPFLEKQLWIISLTLIKRNHVARDGWMLSMVPFVGVVRGRRSIVAENESDWSSVDPLCMDVFVCLSRFSHCILKSETKASCMHGVFEQKRNEQRSRCELCGCQFAPPVKEKV